jgi:uncharacterized protein YbbK (DUF523 family)
MKTEKEQRTNGSEQLDTSGLWADSEAIRIGISSCLLGQKVRYDGGHKHDRFLTDILGRFVEWVPVCPEVELGMGIGHPPHRGAKQAGPHPRDAHLGS